MAYVLVAIGALMAAAGLGVVGYSTLYVRFEEYWVSLTAGTTLIAGGIVTVALGFAIRALRELSAALPVQGGAPLAQGIPLSPVEPAAFVAEPPAMFASPEPEDIAARSDDGLSAAPTPAVSPHPLRPSPREPLAFPAGASQASEDRLADETIEQPAAPDSPAPPLPDIHHEAPTAPRDVEPHDFVLPTAPQPGNPRPAFDESADTAVRYDGMPGQPARPPAAVPVPPRSPEMPDDWLDRALAKLDEELPIAAPPARTLPRAAPLPLQEAQTRLDPPPRQVPASPEPAHAAAAVTEEPAPQPVPEPEPPASAVIGRYEADGTSYVMYADGSIEAQSSAGVYRFSSMAELKSFIES